MTIKWRKTAHKGLRYYEHPTRRHGKKRDRNYSIRFKVAGVDYDYGVGWLSDGIPDAIRKAEPLLGFEEYCLRLLRQYKGNVKSGTGPKSPKEKRSIEEARQEAEREAQAQAEAENITFGQYFENTYFPTFEIGRKKQTTQKGKQHFKKWIDPVIGNVPLKDIKPFAIEKIKKNVLSAGKAPRTLQYIFATIRQAWNHARRDGLVSGDSPTKSVKVPKFDNRRVRFLSHEEAKNLLTALKDAERRTHDMALLSIQTGLRFGEVASLKWSNIDTGNGIISIMNPKGGRGRAAFMTAQIKAMFEAMTRKGPDDFVFNKDGGGLLKEAPKVFAEVVAGLELNKGITDRRQRVTFHTLRHTFASWHAMAGTDIYTLKELLGHSVIAMTERYSHLSPGALQNATRTLERAIESAGQENTDGGQVVELRK